MYVGNYVGVSEIHDINEANVTVAFLTWKILHKRASKT